MQFFMFRVGPEASPSPCPADLALAGGHAFSYSTRSGNGAERCEEPASHLERCTQPERMVFRFSACPDVRGSESGGEYSFCQARKITNYVFEGALIATGSQICKV